jgi:Phage capsid family
MDLSPQQVQGLMQAAEHRTPYSVEIQPKSFREGIQTKAAVTESGIGGSFGGQLPPVQSLYAIGLGYEPVRLADLFPGAAMPGPSATFLTHVSNSAEVGIVAEAGAKGDISPSITETQMIPTKIAGQVSVTLESWQDTGAYGEGSFASWLPTELTRSLVNEESNIIANAVSGTGNATFNGILNTSGTLTRAMGTDSPLDCLAKAYADVRVGAAFADPDLVLIHPNTLSALRRAKDADGRYIMDLLSGPLNLTAYGQASNAPASELNKYSVIPQGLPGANGSLWGATIYATTQVSAGTAVVASIKAGAGIFWQRLGLLIMFDPYTLLTNNEYRWIAEERVAFSSPRPAAINLVTGLPTS